MIHRYKRWGLGWLFLAIAGCHDIAIVTTEPPRIPAPELDGALTWLNSAPLRLADLRGKVVLLDFFEYSCVNCLRTFPYLQEWQKRYAAAGLVVIGIHTPQYGFSMDPKNVYAAVRRLQLTHPVAVDSNFKIAEAYDNRFWPRKFLVDKEGNIRFDQTGEGAYAQIEMKLQELLREMNPQLEFPAVMEPVHDYDRPGVVCYPTTTELYLGQTRGMLGNLASTQPATNTASLFVLPSQIDPDTIYAQGEWEIASDYLRHTRDAPPLADFLLLKYHATDVNVVMKPEDVYWLEVLVQQNGDWVGKDVAGTDVLFDDVGRSYVKVNAARMYNLIKSPRYGTHELRLSASGKGLSVYSYSFGTCQMPEKIDRLHAGKERP